MLDGLSEVSNGGPSSSHKGSFVLLDLRIFARRDDSAREPSKPGGKANARELTAES
jgi:hypothetical protein